MGQDGQDLWYLYCGSQKLDGSHIWHIWSDTDDPLMSGHWVWIPDMMRADKIRHFWIRSNIMASNHPFCCSPGQVVKWRRPYRQLSNDHVWIKHFLPAFMQHNFDEIRSVHIRYIYSTDLKRAVTEWSHNFSSRGDGTCFMQGRSMHVHVTRWKGYQVNELEPWKSWVSREIRVKISLKTKSHWPLQSAEPKFDTPVSWVR